MERPSVAPTRMRPSRSPPRQTAEAVPSGMPSSSDHPTASTASSAETGRRSRKSASTGRPESHETPRSPRRSPASQTPYWTCQGWSRPKKRRNDATTSGDAIEA